MKDYRHLPLTSTHWGAYRAETQDGKVSALHGFEKDSRPSKIGQGMLDVQDGPSRIKTPMVRKSWLDVGSGANNDRRGMDPFVSISWQEAETLVANELMRVKQQFGNQSIYAGSYGWSSAGRFHHAQSQIHRFLNCFGGYTRSVTSYSFAAAEVIVPHVLGDFYDCLVNTTSWPSIIENTELMVAFGGMPLKNGQINSGGIGNHCQYDHLKSASKAGIEFINISPIRTDVEAFVDAEWLPLRPNTDVAILLAIAYTLYTEQLYDKEFIDRYTVGFAQFVPYLTGKTDGVVKDANWAESITEIAADSITTLARKMAKKRTMISTSWSLSRQDHGEQPFWAAITVAAMIGQIGLPGGGIGFGYSATNSIGDHGTKIPSAALPQGANPVKEFIPVARISDMLLNPGKSFSFNGQSLTYPEIHLVYWAGGNPFHHHQDLNRMLSAWKKVDTVIAHEWCWNTLAKRADIVLPCTTPFERSDVAFSPRDPYVIAMEQIVDPVGESRNDYDILCGIARHLGIEQDFSENKTPSQWIEWIYQTTKERSALRGIKMPDYASFQQQGWFKPAPPQTPTVMFTQFRLDPDANSLKTPSGKIEIFSATIDGFDYEDCPGHAAWMPPIEWLGSKDKTYPLHLISNQPKNKLHSQYDHGSYSKAAKIRDREAIVVNPIDAAKRNISNGDIVRVFNTRGECLGGVSISDEVREGVVQMSAGAWLDLLHPTKPSLCVHGNVNVLTADKGTSSLAQGPIAHTCMVDIAQFNGEPPPITAFSPPEIVQR